MRHATWGSEIGLGEPNKEENRSDDPGLSLLTSVSYTDPGPLPESFPKIASADLIGPFISHLQLLGKKGRGKHLVLH